MSLWAVRLFSLNHQSGSIECCMPHSMNSLLVLSAACATPNPPKNWASPSPTGQWHMNLNVWTVTPVIPLGRTKAGHRWHGVRDSEERKKKIKWWGKGEGIMLVWYLAYLLWRVLLKRYVWTEKIKENTWPGGKGTMYAFRDTFQTPKPKAEGFAEAVVDLDVKNSWFLGQLLRWG